ncbi:MAG: alpha/beta hydrolase family protein [Phocaeicola sp.]
MKRRMQYERTHSFYVYLLANTFLIGSILTVIGCAREEIIEFDPNNAISGFTGSQDIEVEFIDSISWYDHYNRMLRDAQKSNSLENLEIQKFATSRLKNLAHYTDSLINTVQDSVLKSRLLRHGDDGKEGTNGFIGYKYINMRYWSIDKDNSPIHLSQLVIFPYNNIFPNPYPDNLILGCHVTITSNNERPSAFTNFLTDIGLLATHASSMMPGDNFENVVVIPDYQGYGATHGDNHPYLYQTLTARQVVDGLIAAKDYIEENEKEFEDNWRTLVVGYSQGGSVALAVQKYLTNNKALKSKLRLAGSICGDGPYDPLATVQQYLEADKIYMPVALGLIVKGMCDANPYMSGKYKPEDYFTEKFLKSNILDWISSKAYSTDLIQRMLLDYSHSSNSCGFVMKAKTRNGEFHDYVKNSPYDKSWSNLANPATSYCQINEVFKPEVADFLRKCSSDTRPSDSKPYLLALYDALEMNNLCKGWVPEEPLYFFHSTRDEVVPFVNYQSAMKAFPETYVKGIEYASTSTFTHVNSGSAFYLHNEGDYVNEILGNYWQKRNHSTVKND